MKYTMSNQAKRSLLDSSKGKFFSVEFVKADMTVRKMVAKTWEEKALTYGSHDVRANPCAHKPEIYTLSEDGKFKSVNLSTLRKCVVNGATYEFE